ncbi:hypothetical protein Tco_1245054 [Tanacetum coccineum]
MGANGLKDNSVRALLLPRRRVQVMRQLLETWVKVTGDASSMVMLTSQDAEIQRDADFKGKIIMARIWRLIEEVIMKKIEYYLFDVVVEFHREMITSQLQGKLRLYDEVRARTLFVLSSSNRGRLLGIIDLMRQKNKRMKQEGLNRQIGKLQDVT